METRCFWEVIYNGESPQSAEYTLNSTTEIQERDFFLTPSRTDYIGKGLDILLDVASRSKTKFILCGPQGEGHEILEQKLKQNKNIVYLGRVSEQKLNELYHLCKAVIFPSRFEGFGFPVLEAFQHRKPLIVSNGGALPEVAGNAGLIFEAGNAADLEKNIENLQNMQEMEIKNLIEKGNERLKCFSWKKCINEMAKVFEEVA